MTPKEFRTKRGLAGIFKSAAEMAMPKREQIATPRLMSTAGGDEGADGVPALLIHLPTPRPRMLSRVSKNPEKSQRNEGGEIFIIDQPVMA